MIVHIPKFITQEAAAELLGITSRTLRKWEKTNCGPPRRKVGKSYYYTREGVSAWAQESADKARPVVRTAYRDQIQANRLT